MFLAITFFFYLSVILNVRISLGFWIHNLEALAKNHHVYAFDILGLARSSRPSFSNDALKIEQVNIYLIMIDSDRSDEKIEKKLKQLNELSPRNSCGPLRGGGWR